MPSTAPRIGRLGGALAIALLAIACRYGNCAFAADVPTSQPAQTVAVPASIEAFESADQYAKVSGYVSEVKADIGDHVKAGQPLAKIDVPELEKEAAAGVATLNAKKELAKAADAAVEQSQKSLSVARSLLGGYQADLKLAETTLKRQEDLFKGKAITDQQLDEMRTKTEVSRAQSQVGDAKVAAAEADVRAAEANRAVASAQVDVAAAESERLASMLRYTTITAPFDGVVTRRLVNRGDLTPAAGAGRMTSLFTVQRIDTVRIFCDVPESTAVRIQPGATASIKVIALAGQIIEGKVTRIAMALNPETRTMRAEIDVPNPSEKLRPGMYAQATLTMTPPPIAETPGK